jgi:DNA-binding transcriptional LysR family regulator
MIEKKRSAALDWEDVRFFAALARRRTLAATARDLKVTHATVARRLANLETTLGHPLFTRSAGGFTLNADGATTLAEAAQMEMAACSLLTKREPASSIAGLVRVTIARVFADGFLAERLAPLQVQHPQLQLELMATSRNLSLARREAEIALRLARPASGELVARRIATLDYGFYASPEYAAVLATGATPAFIAFDDASEYVPEASWAKRLMTGQRVSLHSNSQTAQAAAARGGAGIALLPGLLARTMTGLVPVPFAERPPPRELWMLMRPDVARLARVRAVADHLVRVFEETSGSEIDEPA